MGYASRTCVLLCRMLLCDYQSAYTPVSCTCRAFVLHALQQSTEDRSSLWEASTFQAHSCCEAEFGAQIFNVGVKSSKQQADAHSLSHLANLVIVA